MSTSEFFMIGVTHQKAPIEVRERLSPAAEEIEALGAELAAAGGLSEFTLLSTCNRLEYYGVAPHPAAAGRVQEAFCARRNFDPAEFEKYRTELKGIEALGHLFDVAAGLDSQMLGETEIFGQVKEAYAAAQARGSTGPVLNKVFQKAFQAAKHVRATTAITVGQVSVANVAVELALDIFGPLSGVQILLLGAGEIGEKTARAFRSRGASAITVSSRRKERSAELAAEFGAAVLPFEDRESRLGESDVVVCATAAPGVVLTSAAAAAAMRKRPARPLFFIDLAVPRDVEPAVAAVSNVFLYNLDDLARIADENKVARGAEIAKCRTVLAERAGHLWRQIEPRLSGGADQPRAPFTPAFPEGQPGSGPWRPPARRS